MGPQRSAATSRLVSSKSAGHLGGRAPPIAPATSDGVMQNQQSMQEFRRMLEETKKEIRDIRALESRMKWKMARDAKTENLQEERANSEEIRDWRWKQSEILKEGVVEK